MKAVRFSASCTGQPYPQKMFLVLIFTRGWVDPRAMVRSEGNMSLKNPVTPPGIDPGTIWLVVQHLNHYATPARIPCCGSRLYFHTHLLSHLSAESYNFWPSTLYMCCSVYCLFVLFSVLFVSIVLSYVLFVCKCVLYYCHWVATELQSISP